MSNINDTINQHARLHRGDLFSSSVLLSQKTAFAAVVILSISLLWQWYQRRKFYQGLPGPPHSLLFGHLPSIIEATRKYPADARQAPLFVYLLNKYNLWSEGLVYIDTYPLVSDNLLITTTPEAVTEITKRNFAKHPFMTNFYGRLIGLKSMTLAEGQRWKDMRKTFNPGFSLTNVMTLMPEIVKQGEILTDKLSRIARSEGFAASLEELARGITLDIIFHVVLGLETNTQRDPKGNEVGNLLKSMSRWMGSPRSMNLLMRVNVPRWIMLRWNEWKIRKILNAAILKRWELVRENQAEMRKGSKELKLVIDLALKQYCDENAGNAEKLSSLSNEYLNTLSDNIKSFIFGGHETTASSIAYAIYELSRNPDILELVRKEHAEVFGPDLDTVPGTLLEKPHLVNQLPLTIAVIKETLRLYPPGGGLRSADKGSTITLNNKSYPLSSQLLWIAHPVLFRSPIEFPNPNLFLPQRFLPSDFSFPSSLSTAPKPSPVSTASSSNNPNMTPNLGTNPVKPNPHAQSINPDVYRPFERGSRFCIGQELALLELKVVLLLVLRKFTFRNGYDELAARRRDRMSGARTGWFRGAEPVNEAPEWGGKAYTVSQAGAKPKDGLPVWVSEEGGTDLG